MYLNALKRYNTDRSTCARCRKVTSLRAGRPGDTHGHRQQHGSVARVDRSGGSHLCRHGCHGGQQRHEVVQCIHQPPIRLGAGVSGDETWVAVGTYKPAGVGVEWTFNRRSVCDWSDRMGNVGVRGALICETPTCFCLPLSCRGF